MTDGKLATIAELPDDFAERFRAHRYADEPPTTTATAWTLLSAFLRRLHDDVETNPSRSERAESAAALRRMATGEFAGGMAILNSIDRATTMQVAADHANSLGIGLEDRTVPTSPRTRHGLADDLNGPTAGLPVNPPYSSGVPGPRRTTEGMTGAATEITVRLR